MNEIQIWQGPNGIDLPNNLKNADELIPYAKYLTESQQRQIILAFQINAFDMAAEYAWKKAMVKLKETIATLGIKFIGEMLGRDDFDETTQIDSELTDYTAIKLAEQLGVIGSSAALKLRQSNELINHYFSKNADESLDYHTAVNIVKSSIQYILGEQDTSIAIEFSNFRDRLLSETLTEDDSYFNQIKDFPLFYLRTIITVMISSIKNDIGAKLEHALANLNLIIPYIWSKLGENDKWNIGFAYRDVTAAGNLTAASGLKNTLLKVNGFDFVPENLRSLTFIKTAEQVLSTHFAFNNFYNEPAIVRKLSNFGTSIPTPALIKCLQAYLAVYLGNSYGVSINAAPIAHAELSKLSRERWYYYFEKVIHTDDIVLLKMRPNHVSRFNKLLIENNLNDFIDLPKSNQKLYDLIIANDSSKAEFIAYDLYNKIKGIKK